MELFVVIMAGGVGSRFWPRSREKKPKQLLRIIGDNTMIRDTVNRLDGLVKKENIYVVTNKIQKDRVTEILDDIPEENIIAEPFGKNTAVCIGLASILIKNKSEDSIIITLPADHIILDIEEFQNTIKLASDYAYKFDGLVTIGMNPTRPETGYGYIQIDDAVVEENFYKVQTFAEKPNLATAKRFIKSGDFFWNSGMFIWKTEVILNEIKKHMPELHSGLKEIERNLDSPDYEKVVTSVYGQLRSISIDYGIMEKSENVYLTKGFFDWSDVGSWEAVYQILEKDETGNAKVGDVYVHETNNSYIFSPKKFTALIGTDNLVVIDTNEALLICNRNNAQDVKLIVDYLKMNNRSDLL